jgi:hypothetical protein
MSILEVDEAAPRPVAFNKGGEKGKIRRLKFKKTKVESNLGTPGARSEEQG